MSTALQALLFLSPHSGMQCGTDKISGDDGHEGKNLGKVDSGF